MRVSVIIPIYNTEKYLQECLNSVLNQTYPEIEIIAVNDGSTDNSLEILKKYSNKIKIISKENGGTASALNAGINIASGEWIKQLDADNVLLPEAVEELVSEAKKIKDKTSTILFSNYYNIDSKGELIDEVIAPNYNEVDPFDLNVILLDHKFGISSSTLIHKSTIAKYGMFDETVSFEDYELWLRYSFLCNCRFHLVQKTLVKLRIHQGQITKTKTRVSLVLRDKVKKSVLDKLSPADCTKYEIALRQYKKSKPITEKCKYFVRYKLFRLLPTFFSINLINAYWYARKKKDRCFSHRELSFGFDNKDVKRL